MRRLRRVLAAVLLAAGGMGTAFAGAVWWSSDSGVSRLEPETGQLRTLATPARVHAIAPLADGSAWLVQGDVLMHVSPDLATSVVSAAKLEATGEPTFAAAVADGGVWVAQGRWLRRFDNTGVLVVTWRHEAPVSALAVGGPRAVWIADATGIHQYTEEGSLLRSIRHDDSGTPSAMLLDAAGGYLWVLTAEFAVQFDVLARFEERSRIALPPATSAAAVDAATGALWLLSNHRLIAFDRDAVQVASTPVPIATLSEPSALVVDAYSNRLWIGDLRGTTAFNRETLQWIRLTNSDPTASLASAFYSLSPTLSLSGIIAGPPTTIRFQFGALCNGIPCPATSRYRREFDLRATIAGADVADRFAVDFDAGTADLHNVESLASGLDPLRASVADSYGNRSAELEVDLHARPAAGHGAIRPKVLPVVSITAPANNAIFVAPATVAITASASDSDGTITKVEFYRNAVLLGTDTTSPYSYSWTNVAVGTYALTAKAYDNAGGITTSAIVNIQVKANVAPTVSLTAPANNAAYTAPAIINMTATAADSDGTVAKVEFYQGATKLNTDTAAPYAFTWGSVAGGTYSLTAKATDDKGAVTTSSIVTVKVNKPPTVALSAPADNTILLTPASVTITATASDSDGSVTKVEFYKNGVLLGTDTSSPYSFAWANIPIGTYVLTAKATDNLGATTTSAARTLTVNTNQPPVVTLTAPANGATLIAGVPLSFTATASDPDGTIAKVEFFTYRTGWGSSQIGTDTTVPYSISNALFSEGSHQLTAVATDNKGLQTTSAPITVTVVANQYPLVTMTSPLMGQVFPSLTPPDITLAATASDADGSIVNVKFYYLPSPTPDNLDPVRVLLGTVTSPPYQLVWHAVPFTRGFCDANGCSPDHYEVYAIATDNGGLEGEGGVGFTVLDQSPWTIQIAMPGEGGSTDYFNAPATVVLSAIVTSAPVVGDAVAKVEFLADGNVIGTIIGAPNGAGGEYVVVWRNLGAGTREVIARLYDAAGFVVNSYPVTVRVRDFTEPPTVTVTAPANGQTYMRSGSGYYPDIPMTAVASDVDGTISEVGIIFDDLAAWTGTSSPFSTTRNAVPEGLHVISASATDNGFATTRAKPVYVRVLQFNRLQAVVLTSPTPGAVTNPVVLAAEVGAPEGGMNTVYFYRDTTLIGSVAAPPYRLTVSLPNGTYALKAVAVMWSNLTMASTPVTVTVSGSNVAPTVSLTAPTAGQTFPVGSTVALAANASDSDGSIAKVEFFAGSTLLATDTSSPYAGTWTPTSAGTFALTARATDNQGGTKTTTPFNVTIGSNAPPQVSLTAPTSGQTFFAGVPFAITANATDSGGTVTKVEFYAGAILLGTDTSSPYTINWSAPAAGTYVLTAKATDNSNAVTTSAGVSVTITANAIPTVALSMPRNGQTFVTGGTVNLIATATDGDGSIARVEFYSGTTLLGSVTAAPYAFTWSNVATGSYTLTARVIDNRGAVTTSAPVAISVQPLALSVTSPTANASIAADFVLITGTFTAPANSGVTVNGIVAKSDGQGTFFVNNFPLAAGANTLDIKLTTLSGQTVSQTMTVTSSGAAPFQIFAVPDDGPAPLTATIRVSNRGSAPLATIGFANLGPGVLDTSNYSPEAIARITYAVPGVYQPRFTLTDSMGNAYTQTVALVVRDTAVMDQKFLSMLTDFTLALGTGNKALAMQYLSAPMQARFGPVVDALSPSLAQIIGTFKGFGTVSIDEEIASYAAKRVVNGKTKIFLMDIARDFDGVWRIDSM